MIIGSRQVDRLLRLTILGGGITPISLGSKINPRIKKEFLIKLKINTLLDSLHKLRINFAQSTTQVPQPQLSLEDTFKAFRQTTTQAIVKVEGQIG
jgi:hypothetical protein